MTRCRNCGDEICFSIEHLSASRKYIPLDYLTRDPHKCQTEEVRLVECMNCGRQIYFDAKVISVSGKMIPVDYETDQPHQCISANLKCKNCGEWIYFDPDFTSESGKRIPLDSETEDPHECLYGLKDLLGPSGSGVHVAGLDNQPTAAREKREKRIEK